MHESDRGSIAFGVVLIVVGVLFFIGRATNLSGSIWLMGLGALFMLGYFTWRSYGLLIPGCILLGLGLGEAFLNASDLGLGLGFIAIFVIDSLVYRQGAGRKSGARISHWWPLIPGVIIAGDSVGEAISDPIQRLIADWWPLALVLIGVMILFGQMSRSRTSN